MGKSLLAVVLASGLVAFGDPTSGPAVGEKLADAKVKGILGSVEGKEFNILDRAKKEPTVIVFVHKLTRPTFRFLKEIDKTSGDEKIHANFIWLTDDVGKTEEYLKVAKGSLSFNTPVGICLDGAMGPNGYGLNDQVDVTILLARDGAVTANFALVGPNETAAPKVAKAIAELLKKSK